MQTWFHGLFEQKLVEKAIFQQKNGSGPTFSKRIFFYSILLKATSSLTGQVKYNNSVSYSLWNGIRKILYSAFSTFYSGRIIAQRSDFKQQKGSAWTFYFWFKMDMSAFVDTWRCRFKVKHLFSVTCVTIEGIFPLQSVHWLYMSLGNK